MKTRIVSFLLFFVATLSLANATSVYYQPTPFPTRDIYGGYPGHANRHILNGWLTNIYYGTTFQKDEKLQVGGWGDVYRTYLQFDVEGLPTTVSTAYLGLYAYPRGDSSTLTTFYIYRPSSAWATSQTSTVSWDTSISWSTQPSTFTGLSGWYASTNNSFWFMDITSEYSGWRSGSISNNGLMISPATNNNNFDVWSSSRTLSDGQRPLLYLVFTQPSGMPNFKMPLPGGATWLLTNEAGGFDSQGESPNPDSSHQGNNYFSLDFSQSNHADAGGSLSTPPPILAVANGTVIDVGGGSLDSRGYYVTLDHGSGYQTRYIHLAQPAARKNGTLLTISSTLNQGDQLGIMGNTGTPSGGGSYPTHLHINFWINGVGSSSGNLVYAVMEGLLLKSYQTESSVDSTTLIPTGRIRYYHSSNSPTGL